MLRAAERDFNVATEDPAASLGGPIYTGVFSYLGVLGWWTAAVIAFTTGALLARRRLRAAAMPFLALAFLSALFAFDDMLLVHEALDQHAGIPQYVSFGVYALVFGLLMWRYRAFVRGSDWALVALFVVFFGLAGVVDEIGDIGGNHHNVPEEALELLGIFAWALYCTRCSLGYLTVRPGKLALDSRRAG